MTLSQNEYEEIMNDDDKFVWGDIAWVPSDNPDAQTFRVDIESDRPLFVQGWCNPFSGKLSYTIVHREVGRIYGLDLGAGHNNPDGQRVGEMHKNYWRGGHSDWAYVPQDITAPLNRPLEVWEQFCNEANLQHLGRMSPPRDETESSL